MTDTFLKKCPARGILDQANGGHVQLDDLLLIDVLSRRAAERPLQPAFVHLFDGQDGPIDLTFGQLNRHARAIAAHLQDMNMSGQRVLLVFPPGLDFIAAFFGCLYAGCVAVPTYPPHRHRMLERFQAVYADTGALVALSNAAGVAQFKGMRETVKGGPSNTFSKLVWLATDEIPDTDAERWREQVITPDALAMLQYTSGSTRRPKGVMLSHANLMANIRAITHAFGVQNDDRGAFWLPMFHDMGLVGGVLAPVFTGITNILLPPTMFLQNPITWLSAISKYRATISGGPSFAYDLCIRKITEEQRATLDLSSWSLAFAGAEPIDPGTLERFAVAFGPCGFKASAFYPCYGLAEATLMVSGPKRGSGATSGTFSDTALTENRSEPVPEDASQARRLVACGAPIGSLRLVIVDPLSQLESTPGGVGEIWVAGASVGQGYWHKPEETRRSFEARLSGTGEGPFLRTGDLGFLHAGQLYVTGRLDDLIIVRGLNRYPQDIEATVRGSHPLLEAGYGAAFGTCDHEHQRLILVQEVARKEGVDLTSVLDAIRQSVLDEHGLALDAVVLVRSGTISRTTSGKIQRHACRTAFLEGTLKVLAAYGGVSPDPAGPGATLSPDSADMETSHAQFVPHAWQAALNAVRQHARALAGAALPDWQPDTPLTALGLDSLQRMELVAKLEKSFSRRLPGTVFSQSQTLEDLVWAVQEYLVEGPAPVVPANQILPENYEVSRFPEYSEMKRQERRLLAIGDNPYFRVDQGGAGNAACIEGRPLVNFSVYDYVGLAHDSEVAAAAKAAIDRYGTSAGASRLVAGEKQVHGDLEQALADYLGTPAAITFVSGHATNVTTIGHLFGKDDLILHDILAHNSIVQGAMLAGATRRSFAHNDWQALDALLSEVRSHYRRVLIAIEGVYSMDGDFPELPRFLELRRKHKTLLLVDEAHSLGTMGTSGRGIGEHWKVVRSEVDLWMGTLSKSLASCGGYIAGSADLVKYLKYTAPGFVYSVGLSPSAAAAALAALTVLRREPQRVARLRERAALFLKLTREHGLDTGPSAGTPVVPIIVGSSIKALRLSRALFDRGINVHPILPPAVPDRSARLRFFITTNHSEEQIRATVSAVADELAKQQRNGSE
jgi:8-amino-7-oxononanoate synthase